MWSWLCCTQNPKTLNPPKPKGTEHINTNTPQFYTLLMQIQQTVHYLQQKQRWEEQQQK